MDPSLYLPYFTTLISKLPALAPKPAEPLKLAFTGFGRPGKTLLIQQLLGDRAAITAIKGSDLFGIEGLNLPSFCTEDFSLERLESLKICTHQDLTLHLIDATTGVTSEVQRLHEMLIRSGVRPLTVLTKIDAVSESQKNALILQCYRNLGLTRMQVPQVSSTQKWGLSELAEAIHDRLPASSQDAFARQQRVSLNLKQKHANPLIYKASLEAGAIALAPLPLGDMPLLTALQILMITEIGSYYGFDLSPKRALEFIATVGAGFGFREIARQAIKLIPGAGWAISSGVAAAGTLALGKTAQIWFQRGQNLTAKQLRDLHAEQKRLAHQNPSQPQSASSKDSANASHTTSLDS